MEGSATDGADGRFALEFDACFDGSELDRSQWLPCYLPQWSSRERTAARYELRDGRLHLRVEADQPAWSPEFDGEVRVSNLQTGVRSGPVGSSSGQHPFRSGLVVREAQETEFLYAPRFGRVEIRAAARVGPGALAALWLIGIEEAPEQSAELCVFEIFGSDVADDGSALVGCGVHPFADPTITDDFTQVPFGADVREPHDYAVEWTPGRALFSFDGRVVKRVAQSPDYPMQLMLNVYRFGADAPEIAPDLVIDHVRGWRWLGE